MRGQTQDPGAVPSPVQNEWLAATRVIASIAIVWLHTFRSAGMYRISEIGRFAVPFFTVIATALLVLSLQRNTRRGYADYARGRFLRLYLPFLAWAVIYVLASDFKRRYVSHQPPVAINPSSFLTGESLQLWYLPFLFLVGLVMFPACGAIARRTVPTSTTSAALVIAGLVVLCLPPPYTTDSTDPAASEFAYWVVMSWSALPSVFFGIVIGVARARMNWPRGLAAVGLSCMLLATVGTVVAARSVGSPPLSISNPARLAIGALPTLAGVGLAVAVLTAGRGSIARRAIAWPFLAYGIYLAHVLLLEALQAMLNHNGVRPTIPLELVVFLVTVLLSIALCFALNASKYTRWLMG